MATIGRPADLLSARRDGSLPRTAPVRGCNVGVPIAAGRDFAHLNGCHDRSGDTQHSRMLYLTCGAAELAEPVR
jgi:hypothetical protein